MDNFELNDMDVRYRPVKVVYLDHVPVYFFNWTTPFGERLISILLPFDRYGHPYDILRDCSRATWPPTALAGGTHLASLPIASVVNQRE